jgi:hypothetical protein
VEAGNRQQGALLVVRYVEGVFSQVCFHSEGEIPQNPSVVPVVFLDIDSELFKIFAG